MKSRLGRRVLMILVVWYGLYQAGHLLLNVRYFFGDVTFPPPPADPPWHQHARYFFHGMATADLAMSALSLVFVVGFFRRATWAMWLGTVCLTASMYSASVFTQGCLAAGTWRAGVFEQLAFYVPFLPVVALFAWMCVLGVRGGWFDFHQVAVRASASSKPTGGE